MSLQRLKQWINNHTRKTSSGEGKSKLLDLSGKAARRWQPYQAYSRLYYDTKLRPIITNAYIEYREKVPDGEQVDSLFKFRNRELRAMLENETSEVKAQVDTLCQNSVTIKEEAEVEKMLNEDLTEEEIKEALRKKSVFASRDIDNMTNRVIGESKHYLQV
jgi:hypothetical protein